MQTSVSGINNHGKRFGFMDERDNLFFEVIRTVRELSLTHGASHSQTKQKIMGLAPPRGRWISLPNKVQLTRKELNTETW